MTTVDVDKKGDFDKVNNARVMTEPKNQRGGQDDELPKSPPKVPQPPPGIPDKNLKKERVTMESSETIVYVLYL